MPNGERCSLLFTSRIECVTDVIRGLFMIPAPFTTDGKYTADLKKSKDDFSRWTEKVPSTFSWRDFLVVFFFWFTTFITFLIACRFSTRHTPVCKSKIIIIIIAAGRRIVTKIGAVFCAVIEGRYKMYFQYICSDRSALNSSMIRVFKTKYDL